MCFPLSYELVVEDDIVYKGQRLIYQKVCGEKLKMLHLSHMGMESTQRRSRDSTFRAQYNVEIKYYISACEVCQNNAPAQQRETLKSYP